MLDELRPLWFVGDCFSAEFSGIVAICHAPSLLRKVLYEPPEKQSQDLSEKLRRLNPIRLEFKRRTRYRLRRHALQSDQTYSREPMLLTVSVQLPPPADTCWNLAHPPPFVIELGIVAIRQRQCDIDSSACNWRHCSRIDCLYFVPYLPG